MIYTRTGHRAFHASFSIARGLRPLIAEATSLPSDLPTGQASTRYYLSPDCASGFGIEGNGGLFAVFSTETGRGDVLLASAVRYGARTLDCYDGYLPKFYGRHGFSEVRREANWTPGEPDVVFMARNS